MRPAILVAILAIAAVLGIIFSGLSPLLRILLSLAVCTYAGWHVHRLAMPRWKVLRTGGDGAALIDRNGAAYPIRIDGRSFVSPLFAGFNCHAPVTDKHISVGLFRVQLGNEAYRQLLVMLRQGSPS
jgi:hypothetical protein